MPIRASPAILLPMELAGFQAVVAYLNETLAGARVERCLSAAPGVIAIELRQGDTRQHLLLGIHPRCAGIALQPTAPPSVSPPTQRFNLRFARALAHTLSGFSLDSVELLRPNDRIARFIFTHTDRYGDTKQRVLQLELTGRTSQLFLLNEREQLISSLRQLDYTHKRARPLHTGKVLPPPPPPPDRQAASGAPVTAASILKREHERFAAFLEPTASPAATSPSASSRRQQLERELTLARQAEKALDAIGESPLPADAIVSTLREATGEDLAGALKERGHLAEPIDVGKLIKTLQRMAASRKKLQELLAAPPESRNAVSPKAVGRAEARAADALTVRLKSFPHKIWRGTTSSGFPLILTFSAEGNYAALKAFGRPEHWFFHARDFAGSYVLLLTGKQKPKPADIKQAALVAAIHSKGKRESELEVSYTQLKYVRKPRHARTGTVLMSREQVISVRTKEWEEVKGKLFG